MAAGCSSKSDTKAAAPASTTTSLATTTTSTTAPAAPDTTTAAPAATTTAAPAPAALASVQPEPKVVLTPTGITAPVVGRQGDALVVNTPCDQKVAVRTGTPVDGVVVLDAGHGGGEPGAQG